MILEELIVSLLFLGGCSVSVLSIFYFLFLVFFGRLIVKVNMIVCTVICQDGMGYKICI